MIVTDSAAEAFSWSRRMRSAGLSIGLVPTMGALHGGHFSLIERARAECDRIAVSIFVNPTQFGPGEDLSRYPRTPDADLAGCRDRGVDLVFTPASSGRDAVYPPGFQTWVEVQDLARPLCGERRPGHFHGVATVVAILFGIFRPHRAYFGQKDYQQARVIERMALDLRLGVQIEIVPTLREEDGLAMSSRNRYLSSEERIRAVAISRALFEAERLYRSGEVRGSVIEREVAVRLGPDSGLRLDYARVLDALTLEPLAGDRIDQAPGGAVVAIAAYAGTTRLIDNILLGSEDRGRPGGA